MRLYEIPRVREERSDAQMGIHKFIGVVVSVAGCLISINGARAELRVGVAAVKISPPSGTPMAGYYYDSAILAQDL